MDKNKQVLEYLYECPQIRDNPLFFNFVNAKEDNNQFLTTSNDKSSNKHFIDGSEGRRYLFTLITFKSMNDLALVKDEEVSNENVDEMFDAQAFIDWVAEQERLRHYPDFGEDCVVDKISTTTENPKHEGTNTAINPPLAMYSVTVRIDYIDYSTQSWS